MNDHQRFYPIGEPGDPWTEKERIEWFNRQRVQRSYRDDVVARIEELDSSIEVIDYGSLPLDPDRYALRALRIPATSPSAPWVLITGGVHGYETSGVHGAISFVETAAESYRDRVNMIVAPCVSPWGYEVINRWNPNCIDPNRSFFDASPSEEAAALIMKARAHWFETDQAEQAEQPA